MGSQNSIGYLEGEALIAVMKDADARDPDRPALRMFGRKNHGAKNITVRRYNRRPQQVRHTSLGGQSVPVNEGNWEEFYYSPTYIKLHKELHADDVALFTRAENAQPREEVRMDANERIRELALNLREDNAEERNRMCLGALRDALTYVPKGRALASPVSVDYGLTAITAPSTAWDNSGATIPDDMATFIKAYRDGNSKGLPPTHVMYNPDMYQPCFLGNTQWNEYKKQVPGLAQGFLGIQGGNREADMLGRVDPLWGLTWVPITGKYVDLDGAIQDRWPVGKLSFFRTDDNGQSLFEWGMLRDPFHNPSAEVNIELKVPVYGDAVKTAKATLFDNGLPVIKDPQMVQHVTIYTP